MVVLIFACGAVLGFLAGYLYARCKNHKVLKDEMVQVMPSPECDDQPRSPGGVRRRPGKLEVPSKIVVTKSGRCYHLPLCHTLRLGTAHKTNMVLGPCQLCFET